MKNAVKVNTKYHHQQLNETRVASRTKTENSSDIVEILILQEKNRMSGYKVS